MSLTELYDKLYQESIVNPGYTDLNNCDKGSTHSYIPYYETLLSDYKNKEITLLEIGIYGGINLLLWEKFFVNAKKIVGMDINFSNIQQKVYDQVATTNKIKLLHGDATVPDTISALENTYDVIVDDGSHTLYDQYTTFKLLESWLNPGGIYIIEDIQSDDGANFLKKSIPSSDIVDLRGTKGRYDDVLLIYKKKR